MVATAKKFDCTEIKFDLLKIFYGIDDFVDLETSIVEMIDKLNESTDEFSFKRKLLDLDIWYIKVVLPGVKDPWNALHEPLSKYVGDSLRVSAHFQADRQYSKKELLGHFGKARFG